MYTDATLSIMADAIPVQTIKLHSGAPGALADQNVIAGTETAIAFDAAVDGVRDQSAPLDIDVPAGDVSHYSLWDGATLRRTEAFPVTETYTAPGIARVSAATLSVENPA